MSLEPTSSIFVSYTQADKTWAEWIAWTLEAAGQPVKIQAWDFRPGSNFVVEMDRAARESNRTLVVLSSSFLQAAFTHSEWAAAFARDPKGRDRRVVPVRIDDCAPDGLLGQIVWIDLVGLSEEAAQVALLEGLEDRAKPTVAPAFPAGRPASAAPFPEAAAPDVDRLGPVQSFPEDGRPLSERNEFQIDKDLAALTRKVGKLENARSGAQGPNGEAAQAALLQSLEEQGKPTVPPAFPAGRPANSAPFPGAAAPDVDRDPAQMGSPHWPSGRISVTPEAERMPRATVFISYCHKDEVWKEHIAGHLRVVELGLNLEVWDDGKIPLGEDWYLQIEGAIGRARIAILVISDDFLNSPFIRGEEIPRFLKLQVKKGLTVIPVIARPCDWEADKWLASIECFPKGRALSEGTDPQIDKDLATLAQEVRRLWALREAGQRRLLWNLGLLFLVVLGLACFPTTHVSLWSGIGSAVLGSSILGGVLLHMKRAASPAAKVLENGRLTYRLGASVVVLAILNYIFFPTAAIEIALGKRVFHKLAGQEYTLLVKRGRKPIVEQRLDSRAVVFTGAPEVSLHALFYSSKDRLKDELQDYLERGGGDPQGIQEVLAEWLPNGSPRFVASRALRQGDHIVVEIPCPERGKIMIAKEVHLKADQPPVFLEMGRGNPCATNE